MIYIPEKWIGRLDRTSKIYKPMADESVRFRRGYLGDFRDKDNRPVDKKSMIANFIYYYVESIYPAVYSGEPKVLARPRNNIELREGAKIAANNVNYWFRELDAKAEIGDAVFARFYGPGAVYSGWEFETGMVNVKHPNGLVEKKEKVFKDQPLIRWLDFYQDVRLDPDAKQQRYSRWMAVRSTIPYEEFLELDGINESFKNGPKKLAPEQRPEDRDSSNNTWKPKNDEKKSDAEWISYWEIWDRQNMKKLLVHEKCPDNYLNDDFDWPYDFEYKNDPYPVTIINAKRDFDTNLSVSEFKPIEDQIWERNRLRSVQAAIVKRIAPRYMYARKAATQAQITKFQQSDLNSFNEFNDPGQVMLAPEVKIPASFFEWDGVVAEDLGNVSGLSEFENARLANTATEASIAEGRSNVRKSSIVDTVEDFVAAIGGKVGGLCAQLQKREMTIAISPQETQSGEWEQISVTSEALQGEFDYELIPGAMEHVNENLLKQESARFLEIAQQSGELNIREYLRTIAPYYKLNPDKVLLTDEQKKAMAPPPEPTVKFANIKMEEMSPVDQVRVVEAAKAQNDVQNLAPPPPEVLNPGIPGPNALPMNESQNMVGNPNPAAPVHPNSLEPTR